MIIDFLTLAQQNMLTYNDEKTHFYVKPIDKHNYTSYPLENLDNTVLLTAEEYLGLRANYYQFNDNLTGIELYSSDSVN